MSIIIGRNKNLRKLLEFQAEDKPDKDFIIFIDKNDNVETLTYKEFNKKVNKLANALLDLGIKKGDFVTCHLPNSTGFCLTWFATSKIGAIMIPTNIMSRPDEMEYMLNHSESGTIITDPEYMEMIDSIKGKCPNLKNIILYRAEEAPEGVLLLNDILKEYPDELKEIVDVGPMDVSNMLYTSGTTARPKGVLLTHGNSLWIGETMACEQKLTTEDRHICVLPLFHVNAQYISFMPTITAGASIIICERFSASRFFKYVREYGATITSLVATNVRQLLAQPRTPFDRDHKMRRICFAIAITDEQWDEFETRFNTTLHDLYGLTETLAPCTFTCMHAKRKRGSVGLPTFGVEIKIVDDNRNEVPIGEVGEIAVHGTPGIQLMKGYYKNPEATAEVLDENNWFYTGDYGKMDEDGYVYFIDRKKDVIKRAGENIAAQEVERVLTEHPAIVEAAVIGVPDEMRDWAVKAFILLKEGMSVTADEVKAFCAERLAKFKVPEFIEVVKEFPKTSIGKIQKNILKKRELEKYEKKS
ncbi:MAG: ATP-dependent acyl-CoA ligase [Candidatus Schekmanbacteria bacterium]|nr:MAG: ATP-dependent acyl-CoA ligase [Candidatus Schekmanbacteria bacterium]